MRDDVLVSYVENKCEVLKRSRIWLSEPRMRPSAWLGNFDDCDKQLAAKLLNNFVFCNDQTTNNLLRSSWNSLADGLPKGPSAPSKRDLLRAIESNAVFTPVEGENPNPTDSGNFICRKVRQVLGVSDDIIIPTQSALRHASKGGTVVFVDDFIGSGDQFLSTWKRVSDGVSFASTQKNNDFTAIYITLVTTDFGLEKIYGEAPTVAICPTHILKQNTNIEGLILSGVFERNEIEQFLSKYARKLSPTEPYMIRNPEFIKYGYKHRGLMMGFEHSIPDATLPIFWSPGIEGWEPLIERT